MTWTDGLADLECSTVDNMWSLDINIQNLNNNNNSVVPPTKYIIWYLGMIPLLYSKCFLVLANSTTMFQSTWHQIYKIHSFKRSIAKLLATVIMIWIPPIHVWSLIYVHPSTVLRARPVIPTYNPSTFTTDQQWSSCVLHIFELFSTKTYRWHICMILHTNLYPLDRNSSRALQAARTTTSPHVQKCSSEAVLLIKSSLVANKTFCLSEL